MTRRGARSCFCGRGCVLRLGAHCGLPAPSSFRPSGFVFSRSLAYDLYARRTRTCSRTQHTPDLLQPAALALVSYL
jgi:hypothetical protein